MPHTRPCQNVHILPCPTWGQERIPGDLREYYGNVKGLGFFATVHNQGQIDMAVYSRLRIRDEKTIAFIMPDRLTHHNLQSCNHAAYLIKEQVPGYTHPYYSPFMFAEPPSSKRGFVIFSTQSTSILSTVLVFFLTENS